MKLLIDVPDELLAEFADYLDTDHREVIKDVIMNYYDSIGMCTHDYYQILYDRIDVKFKRGRKWIQT